MPHCAIVAREGIARDTRFGEGDAVWALKCCRVAPDHVATLLVPSSNDEPASLSLERDGVSPHDPHHGAHLAAAVNDGRVCDPRAQ